MAKRILHSDTHWFVGDVIRMQRCRVCVTGSWKKTGLIICHLQKENMFWKWRNEWNVCFSAGASSPRGWQYNNNVSRTCMVVMSDWRTRCILIYWAQKKKKNIHYITHTLELCSDIAELLEDPACSEEVNVPGFNGRKTNWEKMKKKKKHRTK